MDAADGEDVRDLHLRFGPALRHVPGAEGLQLRVERGVPDPVRLLFRAHPWRTVASRAQPRRGRCAGRVCDLRSPWHLFGGSDPFGGGFGRSTQVSEVSLCKVRRLEERGLKDGV